MFKNLVPYIIGGDLPEPQALRAAMELSTFVPCMPTQPSTCGWVPPRGEAHGELLEIIGGQWVAALMLESRLLPAPVVKRHTQELADKFEAETGRKPRGKLLRELKERAVQELLPKSFTRRVTVLLWINPAARLVVIDTGSSTRAKAVADALIAAAGRMNLAPLLTATSPTAAMTHWLATQEPPPDFSIDRECELKQPDSEKAVVRYARHPLDIEEVKVHIEQGKLPTLLAMTYRGRVSFVLHDDLTLKGVEILDVALEEAAANTEAAAAAFDADIAIGTGELAPMLAALVEALGGVQELPIEAAAKEGQDGAPEAAGEAPPPWQGDADADPLYAQAVATVREHKRPSISLVQRYLRIGYNRAARLLERMEAEGIVSPMAHDGARTLLATAEA